MFPKLVLSFLRLWADKVGNRNRKARDYDSKKRRRMRGSGGQQGPLPGAVWGPKLEGWWAAV